MPATAFGAARRVLVDARLDKSVVGPEGEVARWLANEPLSRVKSDSPAKILNQTLTPKCPSATLLSGMQAA
jgi:hypothetical protein